MLPPVMATVLCIDRPDGSGIDLSTVEYVVSFGDAEDEVGAVIVARPKGLDALITLLRNFPIFPAAIETAIRTKIQKEIRRRMPLDVSP